MPKNVHVTSVNLVGSLVMQGGLVMSIDTLHNTPVACNARFPFPSFWESNLLCSSFTTLTSIMADRIGACECAAQCARVYLHPVLSVEYKVMS